MFKVIKVKKDRSKHSYDFYWVFFRDLKNGKSARTYVCSAFGNWRRWWKVIRMFKDGEEVFLSGLVYRRKGLIDADSVFTIVDSRIVSDVIGG